MLKAKKKKRKENVQCSITWTQHIIKINFELHLGFTKLIRVEFYETIVININNIVNNQVSI